MPGYLTAAKELEVRIPKVDKIRKEKKSIEDLLRWNGEVTRILRDGHDSLLELELSCNDFKVFNPFNEKLISCESFTRLRKYTAGVFDEDKFPKFLSPQSVMYTPTLNEVCFKFSKMSTAVAEVLIRYYRESEGNLEYKLVGVPVRKLRFEYEDREREAVLSLLSGVLHNNPILEQFELISTSAYIYLNVNNFLENFEDFQVGPALKKLTLRDSMKYTDRTKFLDEGTHNVEELCLNKSILNQKNFRLSDNIRILKLTPVNFSTDIFEVGFDQFLFVIENLQHNTSIEHFEMGIRHGNIKKKIFNSSLYEKERKICT